MFNGYRDDENHTMNCYNLTFVNLTDCIVTNNNYTVEVYDILSYLIYRDEDIYYFANMGVVVKNIPTLPYVAESVPIGIEVLNSTDGRGQLKVTKMLGKNDITYSTSHLTTKQVGAVFDRDFYP